MLTPAGVTLLAACSVVTMLSCTLLLLAKLQQLTGSMTDYCSVMPSGVGSLWPWVTMLSCTLLLLGKLRQFTSSMTNYCSVMLSGVVISLVGWPKLVKSFFCR